jgi:hypothetical protein
VYVPQRPILVLVGEESFDGARRIQGMLGRPVHRSMEHADVECAGAPFGKSARKIFRDMAATKTLAVERRLAPGCLDTFRLAVVEKTNIVALR